MNNQEIKSLAVAYDLSKDDFWKHKQSGKWILKHDAVEKIAKQEGIIFDLPIVASSDINNVALIVQATHKDQKVWTMGEARKENCVMAYYWAMAEKRAKDRCVLKILGLYERGVSSDAEADEFNQSGTYSEPKQDFEYNSIKSTQKSPSAKQVEYIKSLLKQGGESEDKFDYDEMDADQASDIIGNLISELKQKRMSNNIKKGEA